MMADSSKKWSLFHKLKKAVKKLKMILASTDHMFRQWSLASISSRRPPPYTRHLSFNNGVGINHGCLEDNHDNDLMSLRSLSFGRIKNNSKYGVEDIDRRADVFIDNFHRQLRMERQISLEFRYCNNTTSLEYNDSNSNI